MGNWTAITNANVTHMGVVAQVANDYTGGLFGIFWVITTFVVAFISLQFTLKGGSGNKGPFAGAMFISTVICFLLRMMNMVPDLAFIICIIMTAGSVAWLAISNN